MQSATKKRNPAFDSGMRGGEKPSVSPERAEDEAAEGRTDETNESSELQDSEELGTTVAEHIHYDPESGHHHLNLTTLSSALGKKGGVHDK